MGQSTIHGPFSVAVLAYQRVTQSWASESVGRVALLPTSQFAVLDFVHVDLQQNGAGKPLEGHADMHVAAAAKQTSKREKSLDMPR